QLDAEGIAQAIAAALRRLDLHEGDRPVVLCYRWQESAMYGRMDAFCRGVSEGLSRHLAKGQPLILVGEGDIGGLIGMHLKQVLGIKNTISSIDGFALEEFDFMDIGDVLAI